MKGLGHTAGPVHTVDPGMCFSIRMQGGFKNLCSHQPSPYIQEKELMEYVHGSLPSTTPIQGLPLISLIFPLFPGKQGCKIPEGSRQCLERGVVSAQEWAGPSHTGAATGCEVAAAAQGHARALPAAHWRWIYGSRARGSHCLLKGCRRHKPAILSLWTCSMQSPGPLHHSCLDSFKPS